MGRAIAILSIIVLCSFAFVVLHLSLRRPGRAGAPPSPGPLLETREDGSISSVGIQLSVFEQRLMEAERRSESLSRELEAAKRDREQMQGQIDNLEAEVRRIRRQAAEPAAPRPATPSPGPSEPAPPATPDTVPGPGVPREGARPVPGPSQ